MSESIKIKEPIFKLVVRFSNGEILHYVVQDPIDERAIKPEIRYAVISSISCANPSECTSISVVNMRDVTFIRTELVTLEQLAGEHRLAGIRSSSTSSADEMPFKSLSQIKFV